MLHIVKSLQKLKLVQRYFQPSDTLLLVENAVYAASEYTEYFAHIRQFNDVYVLQEDLQARGWIKKCSATIQIINRFDFVELTIKQGKSISW